MPSTFVALTTAGALMAAQTGFKDPGPPPVQAAPVPTLEQAKRFILNSVAQYGVTSCPALNAAVEKKSINESMQISIDGNRVDTRHKSIMTTVFNRDFSEVKTETLTERFSLSDVTVDSIVSRDKAGCPFQAQLYLKCKIADCVVREFERIEVEQPSRSYREPYVVIENSSYSSSAIYIKDKLMADMILKAVSFYQTNSPDVAVPF